MGGELTVALTKGLRNSARKVLKNEDAFLKKLDEATLEEGGKNRKLTEAEKEKVLDELYEMADESLTPAEKRWREKQKKRELQKRRKDEIRQDRKRMTNKSDGGQKFKKPVLRKIMRELEEKYKHLDLKVEIVSKNSGHKMMVDGKEVKRFYEWKKKGTLGAFAHHPPPPKLYILDDCTKLTWQHEVWHLEHYAGIGKDAYMKTKPWLREKYVWDRIWKNRHIWTEKELVDSYDYYKMYALGKGENPTIIKEMEDMCLKHPERLKYK